MESRKFDFVTSGGVTGALQSLADKLNEIIDHLNSQDQEGEKPVCKDIENFLKREDTPEGWKGDIFTRFSWVGDTSEKSRRRLVDYIQQLLEDREREVVERFYEIVCKHNEYIGDDYATYLGNPTVLLGELYEAILLSKLNNKKK